MIFIPEIFLALSVILLLAICPFIKKNDYVIAAYSSLLFIIIAQSLVFRDIFHFEEILALELGGPRGMMVFLNFLRYNMSQLDFPIWRQKKEKTPDL